MGVMGRAAVAETGAAATAAAAVVDLRVVCTEATWAVVAEKLGVVVFAEERGWRALVAVVAVK